MSKESVFTMKLEPELREQFMAEAEAADRPASQVVRELMRDYIQRQHDARDYDAFLRRKIKVAKKSVSAGRGRSDADVAAGFAARRAKLKNRA